MNKKEKKKIDNRVFVLVMISVLFLVLLCIADALWNISESMLTGILMLWAIYTVILIVIACIVEKIYGNKDDRNKR